MSQYQESLCKACENNFHKHCEFFGPTEKRCTKVCTKFRLRSDFGRKITK